MNSFKYRVYDSSGHEQSGEVQAESELKARLLLEQQGLLVVSLQQVQAQVKLSLFSNNQLTLDDMEFITAELSLLLRSGVKIDKSLQILARGKAGTAAGRMLTELSDRVKKGESLATALAAYPVFDSLYINLVKMGEASGELPQIFAGLAQDLKFRKELKAKIFQALTYPMVVMTVCVLAVFFVFNFIVPQMASLFDNAKNLPSYTTFVLNVSSWMQQYQFYALAALIAAGFACREALKQPQIQLWLDDVLIKLPLFKTAIVQVERIRFNTSMALMLNAGVTLDQAIELAAGTVKNRVVRQSLLNARTKIKRGIRLTDAFAGNAIYPDFLLSLLEVGEESGQLMAVFTEIADRSRNQFASWAARIASLLEPLMIVVMGAIVGSVVVVMLLSIMSLNDGF
ncbi:type II secretion system F family protein [Rheinheimera sp.]|uniref:type II secretion system F family protein n=1 Tax=Rheinheimera sp. TaxID=1869214 RepID=UPI0027B98EB9|nr:type II secretion system F family protein [Rheinheimera sp.]